MLGWFNRSRVGKCLLLFPATHICRAAAALVGGFPASPELVELSSVWIT
jgi:hypothetical protein